MKEAPTAYRLWGLRIECGEGGITLAALACIPEYSLAK